MPGTILSALLLLISFSDHNNPVRKALLLHLFKIRKLCHKWSEKFAQSHKTT